MATNLNCASKTVLSANLGLPQITFSLCPLVYRNVSYKKVLETLEMLTCIYILLTKHEGCTGRISARGLGSTDRAQRVPYKKDQGPIFSQDGPEQAWLIRDLLHD